MFNFTCQLVKCVVNFTFQLVCVWLISRVSLFVCDCFHVSACLCMINFTRQLVKCVVNFTFQLVCVWLISFVSLFVYDRFHVSACLCVIISRVSLLSV